MRNRKPNRLKSYDYSQNGVYFVTVCAQNHIEWFGNIKNGKMVLNKRGEIAGRMWLEISRHFGDIQLDDFIVMPNHIHGILIVNDVGNRHAYSLQIKRQYQTIPVVIGSYKSAVTKHIHQMEGGRVFSWQKSFYDHVIRSEKSLQAIRQYVVNNPMKWDMDIENARNFGIDNVAYYDSIIK